jgi:hypothetical protein
MKSAFEAVLIAVVFAISVGFAWARQHETAEKSEVSSTRAPRSNAAIMLSSGENILCQRGNLNDLYIVTVSIASKSGVARYISGGGAGGCAVLPITVPVGTQINVSGVLQDTAAIPGASMRDDLISTSESCFNVQGFSVGLAADGSSEYDPADSSNIVNSLGYGFFWYDSDSDLKPGPYSYTVVGCGGKSCPTSTTYYNTDDSPIVAPSCTVLKPFPVSAQK